MKKNLLNKTIAFSLAVLFTAIACACGVPVDEPAQSTASLVLPTATPAPRPVSGGEVRMPMPVNADVSDPLAVTSEELLALFSLIYESVLGIDDSGKIIPGLAENWSCDETGRVWTFRLRAAARWHDTGASITSADVVSTYQRIVSLGANTHYSYVTTRVESMVAMEDGSLVVTMRQGGVASLYALTFPVMRSGAPEADGTPVGTGPYKALSVTDDAMRLIVNTNWWKQTPYIEAFTFYAKDSNEIALASYEAGQLDLVPTSALSVGRYREDGVTNVLDVMTQTAEVMLINYDNANLRDVKVRMAIACAINRGHIITNVYMNRAQACDVPVAPDAWLYESKSKLYDYNTTVALSLLAESGWSDVDGDGYLEKDGQHYNEMTLRLLVNDSTDAARKSAADMIAQQLEAVGIHIELITAGYALEDDASEYLSKLSSREFDLALIGFNLGRDCDLTQYIAQNGRNNYGGYSNAALEQLAQNILTAADETGMREAASEFQMRFAQELPFITLYFRLNSLLYSADIQGISSAREPDILRSADKWYLLSE